MAYTAVKLGIAGARRILQAILAEQRFDLIWVNYAFMAANLDPELVGSTPVVVDQHESEELLWRQYLWHGNWVHRPFAALNLLKLMNLRKRTLCRASVILSVSEREAAFTRRTVPASVRVLCVPNGVDTECFLPQTDGRKEGDSILICGNLSVYRNRQAVLWLATRVLPKIRQSIPEAEFWIVGSTPSEQILQLGRTPGIHVTGAVEDTRPYYAKAKVVVAPYRFGGGTRLKVLEAMAMAMPIVSTDSGCTGIEAVSGRHVLIANDETDFAARIVELLHDAGRRQALGTAARKLVEEKYRWEDIIGRIGPTLSALAPPSAAAPEPASLPSEQEATHRP
jgi:glycosyltransferase involved in cell wall biosynthesis